MQGWEDELSEAERRELDAHLQGCASCREESEHLEALWLQLGALELVADSEIEVPSARLRATFYSFLAEEQRRGSSAGWRQRLGERLGQLWPRQPQAQLALMAAALVLGVGVGLIGAGLGTGAEVRALRTELSAMRESVGLSLLTHPAASERLRGVGLAGSSEADPRVVEALLELVYHDPSVNVRLAAIEALAGAIEQPGVKPQLLRTLPQQDSPLLQMTLLDVLLPEDGEQVLEVAKPLLENQNLDRAVRERLLEAKGASA